MADLVEYIITAKTFEDDTLYEDLERLGGNLYIPDRAIPVLYRRPISRNTHYMLTADEAEQIRSDPRVIAVTPADFIRNSIKPFWTQGPLTFWREPTNASSDINWGLLRTLIYSNIPNWGLDGTQGVTTSISLNTGGANVDVVIVDGYLNPNHPEYAKNSDGSGGTRFIPHPWTPGFTYPADVTVGPTLTVENNNHGAHVAGTAAGNSQGWARFANIYNIYPYGTAPYNPTDPYHLDPLQIWDYIRAFHNSKSVIGRNPTICNCSYGTTITWPSVVNGNTFGSITSATYRSVSVTGTPYLSSAQLIASGIYNTGGTANIPFYNVSFDTDLVDAIADGIIIVSSSGNDSFLTVTDTNIDYNNTFSATFNGSPITLNQHRGSAPAAATGVISVGNAGTLVAEYKANSSNCGDRVNIFAPGTSIMSSVNTSTAFVAEGWPTPVQDPRNASFYITKINGTSMASPNVTGVLACVLEANPFFTQADAMSWITANGQPGRMGNTGGGTADTTSLQGAPNRYLYMVEQRSSTGLASPQRNYGYRSNPAVSGQGTTNLVWPRPKIRVT